MQKHYIVARSSSGIGAELTQKLLSAGHKVTGISRREVSSFSGGYNHIQADLADMNTTLPKTEGVVGEVV